MRRLVPGLARRPAPGPLRRPGPAAVLLVALLSIAVLSIAACGSGTDAGSPDTPTQPISGASTAGSPASAVVAVRGTVRDGSGKPVRGALVVPSPADADTPGVPEIAVLSDAGGAWTWTLRPGSYRIVATLGDRSTEPEDLTVTAGRSSPVVALVLPE